MDHAEMDKDSSALLHYVPLKEQDHSLKNNDHPSFTTSSVPNTLAGNDKMLTHDVPLAPPFDKPLSSGLSGQQHQTEAGSSGMPSIKAIDDVNWNKQHPTYLVMDQINVNILSYTIFALSLPLAMFFLFKLSLLTAGMVMLGSFGSILLLRTFFPIAKKPEGLVLVTGGSSGIGAYLAYSFAKRGHDVLLVGRHQDELQKVADKCMNEYGVKAASFVSDLSVPGSAKELYSKIKAQGYTVDVLVNNAGLGHAGDIMEQQVDTSEAMIGLNCTSVVALTQLFGKDMVRRGRGWILEVSSVAGWFPGPGQGLYHASKHLVRAFTEALTLELRNTGVVVTQLMPGPVRTQFATRASLEKTFVFSMSYVEEPEDVAEAGYKGLAKNKFMVHSSWNAAAMATMMHFLPRSFVITFGALFNSPTPFKQMTLPKKIN